MFVPCCLLPSCCVVFVFELPRVCARLCVRLLEGCFAKAMFLCFCLNLHFLGFTVLPWQATVVPQELLALSVHSASLVHGTTASITAVIFYCRWKSGTTALCAVLPSDGTTAMTSGTTASSRARGG